MTIPANIDVVLPYPGDGTDSTFPITFPTFEVANILAEVEDEDGQRVSLDLSDDFTLSSIGIPNTNGLLTLVDDGQAWLDGANLATGWTLLIKFNSDAYNPVALNNLNSLSLKAIEKELDRLAMAAKAIDYKASRSIGVSDIDDDVDPTLPPLTGNAGKLLQANATEDGFEFGPTAQAIFDAEADAEAAAAAALVSQGLAAASAVAADASADAAAVSAAAALVSENNAETAETNAELAEAESEFWANLVQFEESQELTFADSPYSVDAVADEGKLFLVDDSGGDVEIVLPLIATTGLAWKIGVIKMLNNVNKVVTKSTSPNTIEGTTEVLTTSVGLGRIVYAESPTDWNAKVMIASQIADSGGGGGGLPNGGATGSVLRKLSATDQDAGWDALIIPELQNLIMSESEDRQDADVLLQSNIDAVEAASIAADSALDVRLTDLEDTVIPGLDTRVSDLETSVSAIDIIVNDLDAIREAANVADITERDAIDIGIRYQGLTTFVESEQKTYQLKGGTDNTDWKTFGAGGSAGTLKWMDGAIAPINQYLAGLDLARFETTETQVMVSSYVVPTDYTAGTRLVLRGGKIMFGSGSGDVQFNLNSIRLVDGDVVSGSTNMHSDSTGDIAQGGSAVLGNLGDLDITDSSGQINGLNLAAGQLIRLEFSRINAISGESADYCSIIRNTMFVAEL